MTNLVLIEPDFVLANLYTKYLRKFKYRVRVCTNAQQAVHTIDKKIPDIVVLELQLSAHSGFEFLYELRSYSEWQNIPVIVQTMVPQNVSGLNNASMDQLGIKAFLYKPSTSLSKLLFTLDRQLSIAQR